MQREMCQEIRKTMTDCIMATDMAVHFGLVTQTKALALDMNSRAFALPTERQFLCKMIVHAADLSNPVRPFHMTQRWARLISEEFNNQVRQTWLPVERGRGTGQTTKASYNALVLSIRIDALSRCCSVFMSVCCRSNVASHHTTPKPHLASHISHFPPPAVVSHPIPTHPI